MRLPAVLCECIGLDFANPSSSKTSASRPHPFTTQWDSDSLQCICKVTTDTPGACGPLLLLPRPSALLEMLPKATPPAPLQPLKKYRTAIVPSGSGGGGAGGGGHNHAALVAMAAQVEGDLVFVRGGGGSVEGPPKQGEEGAGSGLFWRGGYSTAGTLARTLLAPAAAETAAVSAEGRGGRGGHNKRRRHEDGEAGGEAAEEEGEGENEEAAATVPPKTAGREKGKGKGGGDGNGVTKNTKQKRSK